MSPPIVREANRVERLAYTRTQAAAALGISRSTFNRRVLPLVETLEMPWGVRLIPVDELQRLLAEQRRPARKRAQPAPIGRPTALVPAVAERIRTERAVGRSLAQIARELNATGTPTAHGGAQWWPSTVRAVLRRAHA
ncbi:MAG TPA: recombinase family protein [Acidimicrobiales bacterium]